MCALRFDLKPSPWDAHSGDIFTHALDNIAKDVEFHLKSRLDSGIDPTQANIARKVTVRNDMGQLVIQEQDQGIVQAENLFTPSTRPPSYVDGKLVFRHVSEDEILQRRTQAIKHSVQDAMTLKFKQYLEDGSKKVAAEKMGIK